MGAVGGDEAAAAALNSALCGETTDDKADMMRGGGGGKCAFEDWDGDGAGDGVRERSSGSSCKTGIDSRA